MPYRVQRIEEFVKQVEAGDLKLRVRVLEVSNFFYLHMVYEVYIQMFLYIELYCIKYGYNHF